MDDLNCHGEVVDQTLRELEFINRWLGGNGVTLNGIAQLIKDHPASQKRSVADMGCGGGDMLMLVSQWAKKRNLKLDLTGIDANPYIIGYAKTNCNAFPEIRLEAVNVFSTELSGRKFDIITATLFTHHFSSEELSALFKQWHQQTSLGVIINDLHRHPFAFYAIKLLTWFFSRSAMVKFDAPLSVRRGFKRRELEEILQRAGILNYELKWKWAFRWQLVIRAHGSLK
jgi:2-polyprenyl-3-methyl-5-hydroxy-6-metoxy-1,4-benzoquinol methylase